MVMTGRIARPAEHWTFLPHFVSTVLDVLGSRDQRRRLRLVQWIIASLVYVGAATLLITGVGQGWMGTGALYLWLGFVALILVTGYAALRSGWTERFRDPSISVWQLSMGVLAVNWGYLICGPMRTSALFPLMVIFAFGAFALRWREMAFLTVLALSSLIAAVVLRGLYPQWVPAQGESPLDQIAVGSQRRAVLAAADVLQRRYPRPRPLQDSQR
jgi:hypothetical protein